MIEYLGHKLTPAPVQNFENDLVCINCLIRLELAKNKTEYYLIKDYIPNVKAGEITRNYNLSCEEQIIKNLLE